MDDLLLRFLRGRTGPEEERELWAWLRESTGHGRRLEDLKTILSLARKRDALLDPGPPPCTGEVVLRARFDAEDARRRPWRRWARHALVPLGAAAAATLVTLGALGYPTSEEAEPAVALRAMEFSTGAGESTTIQMSDGSVVRLGPASRLEILPDQGGRQVMLEGRAFFAITPDESRPFRVITPTGSARVLGTRFELTANASDLRLVVVEGSVVLASSEDEVEVVGGEMTEVADGRSLGIVRAPGLAELSEEWMGHFLVFQETAMREAARQIEEIYGVEVRIADPALLGRTLTVWFSSRPLDEVLTVVCSVIDAPCSLDGGVVTIGSEGRGT